MLLHDPHDAQIREAVLGTLLHTMGKPLLVNANLPSLKVNMNPAQKAILRGHVTVLCHTLRELGWEMSPVCREVIENANERLDGSGYPAGKSGTSCHRSSGWYRSLKRSTPCDTRATASRPARHWRLIAKYMKHMTLTISRCW